MSAIKNLRWWIAGLLAVATALNYLDRQSFPIVQVEITKEIPISAEQFGELGALFLLAYAIMYAVGGRIMDALGTRIGYALMIVWWSVANCLMGAVSSFAGLGLFRFLLGLGEGGGFPGSAKAIAEWFPPRERAMACGIFNTGSAVGAVVAPPRIALVVATLGWRWVFYLTGGAGILWAALWLMLYDRPAASKLISTDEREFIAAALASEHSSASNSTMPAVRWGQLLRYGEVRGLMLAKFLSDAAWYFLIFWLPKYLGDVKHLDIQQIGYFAWIPYAFAGAGSLTGGVLNGWLMRRGVSLNHTRKIVLALSAALVPVVLFISAAPLNLVIVFYSAAMFGHQSFSTVVQTLPADLFPSRLVGSVGGLLGSAGAFGGMLFGLLVGWLVERDGYNLAFTIAGLLHPLALVVIFCTVRKVARLTPNGV